MLFHPFLLPFLPSVLHLNLLPPHTNHALPLHPCSCSSSSFSSSSSSFSLFLVFPPCHRSTTHAGPPAGSVKHHTPLTPPRRTSPASHYLHADSLAFIYVKEYFPFLLLFLLLTLPPPPPPLLPPCASFSPLGFFLQLLIPPPKPCLLTSLPPRQFSFFLSFSLFSLLGYFPFFQMFSCLALPVFVWWWWWRWWW